MRGLHKYTPGARGLRVTLQTGIVLEPPINYRNIVKQPSNITCTSKFIFSGSQELLYSHQLFYYRMKSLQKH